MNARPSMAAKKKREEEGKRKSLLRTQSYLDLFDAIGAGSERHVSNIMQTTRDPITLLRKTDPQGLTPLRKAIALSHGEIARILVVNGADATQKGALNKEALHEASRMGQRTLLAPLLSSPKISVNVKDKFGMTPLHNAVRGRHVKAVEWLLFAGADVHAVNDHDDTPFSLVNPESDDETEKQIHRLLYYGSVNYGPLDLNICCGYVGKKQINNMGGDGHIMFITSDRWTEAPQFVFGIKILPDLADPQIPLRQDELYYGYVFKYRMMHSLPDHKRRVQIYFTVLEEFSYSELILKVCSKSRFLGEIPVSITTYSQHKYINYLASCEMDLQNEGQFVLVKRPKMHQTYPDFEGIQSITKIPLFKFAVSERTFLSPPPDWGKKRRQTELDEHETLIANLPTRVQSLRVVVEKEEPVDTSNNNVKGPDKNANAEEEADEDQEGSEEDDNIAILDWSEPDTCEDFYYMSRGWACHIELRCTMSVETIIAAYTSELENPVVRAMSDFYRIHHPGEIMNDPCIIQIPKTPQFIKVGTVLVFQRQELGPEEKEDPYPNSTKDEQFISEDGRRTKGKVWLDKEVKRWSLIQHGVINKPTRIMFNVDKLCTYVAVQLNIGEEKPELDSDESDSDDYSDDDDFGEEGGEEGERQEGDGGEDGPKKKKKKKKTVAPEGGENQEQNADENNSSNNNARKHLNVSNNNDAESEYSVENFLAGGIEPLDEEFAFGLDRAGDELAEGESSEELLRLRSKRTLSISVNNRNSDGFIEYPFGEPRREDEFEDDQVHTMVTQIALNWRYRNHRETRVLVFTRYRPDQFFDMVVELVQESDMTVRSEARWSDGYRMVVNSPPFLTLTGRAFQFSLDGSMTIDSPADGASRTLIFYSIRVNDLEYVVKRKVLDEPVAGPAGGRKFKKDKVDPMAVSNEIDAYLDVVSYPTTAQSDGNDVVKLAIPLTGPNLWTEKHLQLRIPDNILLDEIISVMKNDATFSINWWKIWILLYFEEKQVDVEKVKQDWAGISELMMKKWFQENIDANDRGVTRLVHILDSLRLEVSHLKLLSELKIYKRKTLDEVCQPRQLDLLFHWAKNTKMTAESFRKQLRELPVMSPLSDQFLMYLNEIINVEDVFEFGAIMEVEDNVINSINGEENIVDQKYKFFKILIKARQKKDEIVAFTLMLTDMVTVIHQQEAHDFVVRETRRWMASIIDTQPETCAKLENLLRTLANTYEPNK